MKNMLFLLLFFASVLHVFAQKENNNWFYYDSVLVTFNTFDGLPESLSDSKIVMGSLVTPSCLSDKNGNLILVTNSRDVNINNRELNFSDSLHIGQRLLSLAVKKPGIDKEYYLFCLVNPKDTIPLKLYYGIISDDSIKQSYTILNDCVELNLLGIRHKNKKDFWIITHVHDTNAFYSYLLSDTGLCIEPVISNIGKMPCSDFSIYLSNSYEIFKGSLDGTKIASYRGDLCNGNTRLSLEVFDFDNSTGEVFNVHEVNLDTLNNSNGKILIKGLDFSPNSKYLYFRSNNYDAPLEWQYARINQLDLTSYENSIIAVLENGCGRSMLIAPNYKIYVLGPSKSNYIGVINNPNSKGLECGYVENAFEYFYDNMENSLYPFPNLVAGLMLPETQLSAINKVCSGDDINITAKITAPTPICTPHWTGPNGYVSNAKNPKIYNAKPEMTGWYKLSIEEINEEFYIDSIYVEVVEQPKVTLDFKNPVYRCHGEPIELKANCFDPEVQYLWSTGEKTNVITVSQDGLYTLTATNSNNCDTIIEIQVYTDSLKADIEAEPSVICTGSLSELTAHPDSCSYQWSTGDTTQSITVSAAGDYWVEVRNANGCIARDTVQLLEYPAFSITVSASDTKPCLGDTAVLTAAGGIAFKWNTGDTASSITITQSGVYSVTATDENGCVASDSIEITFGGLAEPPEIIVEGSIPPCVGDTLRLRCNANAQLLWSTGETSDEIEITESGKYSVTATTYDGCTYSDSADVVFVGIQQVEIVGDSSVCQGKSVELTTNVEYNSYLWSTGEKTRTINVNNAGKYSVIAENEYGCKTYDTIEVKSYFNQYDIMLNSSFDTVCVGESSIRTVYLTNEGKDDIQIDTIYFANPIYFQLVTAMKFPFVINQGKSQSIDIKYTANALGETTTTMTIEIEPCNEITNVELSGYGKSTLSLRLPDTVGTIGTNIDIPLYAKSGCGESGISNCDYDVEIIFGKRLLYPEITNNLVDNRIDGDNRVLHYVFNGKDIMPYETQAATISGLLLTSEKTHYDLLIGEVNVNNPFIEVEKTNGSLELNRICANSMKLLEKTAPLNIKIEENEYNIISVIINTQDVGTHSVELYSIDGKRIFYSSFDKSNESLEEREICIDLEQYAMGVYLLRVAAPSGANTRTIGVTD